MTNRRTHHRQRAFAFLIASLSTMLGSGSVLVADDPPKSDPLLEVTVRITGDELRTVEGHALVKSADGGLLIETRSGELIAAKPDDLIEVKETADQFAPFTAEKLADHLQDELGLGFHITKTKHYVIAANTSPAYTKWCGRLLERLQTAFLVYWRRAGWELNEPQTPLPVIIFADQQQFAEYATLDAGPAIATKKGYYSIRTNRVILADLTAVPTKGSADSDAEILRRVESSLFNLVTVVHEATHQIAFNCGMHTRYADNPMWVTEGMAMFFEAPDLRSRTGWRTIGKLHAPRLKHFKEYAARERPPGSLVTLIANDDRFRDPDTATAAYSESWALTYFLYRTKKKQYVEYLKRLAEKPRIPRDDGETRVKEFETAFDDNMDKLETEFLRFIRRLRTR